MQAAAVSALPAALGLALLFWADRRWLECDEQDKKALWPAMAILRLTGAFLLLLGVVGFTIEMFLWL